MKDKEIRDILISYLKTEFYEVRIYQEKCIASAVCDVMTASDMITGFEIKSDSDSYQRLKRQVEIYDLFFDRNYIVVGKKHIASAESKVPDHWGVIYIDENGARVSREASVNKNVSRRRQLSLLWRSELKNLLVLNKLPLYAKKSKWFIAGKIVEAVGPETLGKQIANELLRRDDSGYYKRNRTIYSKGSDNIV